MQQWPVLSDNDFPVTSWAHECPSGSMMASQTIPPSMVMRIQQYIQQRFYALGLYTPSPWLPNLFTILWTKCLWKTSFTDRKVKDFAILCKTLSLMELKFSHKAVNYNPSLFAKPKPNLDAHLNSILITSPVTRVKLLGVGNLPEQCYL